MPKHFNNSDSQLESPSMRAERKASYTSHSHTKKSCSGPSEFMLLNDGKEAIIARAVMAGNAKRTIDVQSYLLYKDHVTDAFLAFLIKAADRGVRVRFLLDDYLTDRRDTRLKAIDKHPNMAIKLFNPFAMCKFKGLEALWKGAAITRRMHNKVFITDNHAMIIGGRNIAAGYFDGDEGLSFNDLESLTWGPVVEQASTTFDAYWNHYLAAPLQTLNRRPENASKAQAVRQQLVAEAEPYAKTLLLSQFAQNLRDHKTIIHTGYAAFIADSPDKLIKPREQEDLFLLPDLLEVFDKAKREVCIITPYFVPGEMGMKIISELVQRGVKVVVFTNSGHTNNHAIAHAKYIKYRKPLLKMGVEIFEVCADVSRINVITQLANRHVDKKGTLHTKAFVIDREQIFIGSMNFDIRSMVENTEQGIIMTSPDMAGEILDWFDKHVKNISYRLQLDANDKLNWQTNTGDKKITYTNEPEMTIGQKLLVSLLQFLPIEEFV